MTILKHTTDKLKEQCLKLKNATIYNDIEYEECLKNVFRSDLDEDTSNTKSSGNETNSGATSSESPNDELGVNKQNLDNYWKNIMLNKTLNTDTKKITINQYLELKTLRDEVHDSLLENHKTVEDSQYDKLRYNYDEINKNRNTLDKIEDNVTKLDKMKSIEDIKLENSYYSILLLFVIIFIIIAIILIIVYFKF